jgi:hypothetical protein
MFQLDAAALREGFGRCGLMEFRRRLLVPAGRIHDDLLVRRIGGTVCWVRLGKATRVED